MAAERRTSAAWAGWAEMEGIRSHAKRSSRIRSRSPSTHPASRGAASIRAYGNGVAADVEAVRARLESVAEELADMAMDRLRASVAAGADKTSPEERLITRARRSVEKAVVLLGQVDAPPED